LPGGFAVAAIWFMCLALLPAGASPQVFLNCPDTSLQDLRGLMDRATKGLGKIAPSAGAATSADLASHARLAALAYTMQEAFEKGENPEQSAPPGLSIKALIFGDPHYGTPRLRVRLRDTRTLYGFVADGPAPGQRVIVFRGTLQPMEWFRNVQARLLPYSADMLPYGASARVHNGFLRIFSSLRLVIAGEETPFQAALPGLVAGHSVTFVGHSLGGALATLAGVDAARMSPGDAPGLRVVTFASPRVGDPGFAALANALVGRIDRVCNIVDPVTALPPTTPFTPYTHVGTVFRLSSFDWPELNNAHDRAGQQIDCWHSIAAYAFMTDPAKAAASLGPCAR
jgi:hypothetical protein